MTKLLIIALFSLTLTSCAELMGLKPTVAMLQGKKPTVNLTRKPDPLYQTLREMRKIKAEEVYLDKEQECWERSYSSPHQYEGCVGRKERKRGEARRYIKRDQFVTMPDVIPQEFKYFNVN